MLDVMEKHTPAAQPRLAKKILYIGTSAHEVSHYLASKIGEIEVHYKELVYDAFLLARAVDFDIVIVDQRGDRLATKLVLPVLNNLERVPRDYSDFAMRRMLSSICACAVLSACYPLLFRARNS